MISDPQIIDSEIDRCLNLLVRRGTEPSFATTFENQSFFKMERIPMAQLVVEHMLQEDLICMDGNIVKITKHGLNIYHEKEGWLSYRAKLKNKEGWEKSRNYAPIIISLIGLVFSIVCFSIANSKSDAEAKRNNLKVDSLRELILYQNRRIDSIATKQRVILQQISRDTSQIKINHTKGLINSR
jgi:hypothetical protein